MIGYDVREHQQVARPVLYLEDGSELKLPVKREVCPVCDGTGTHVNPSIDSHGIGADEFADDPDFAEEYFGGVYDVVCNECGGRNVVDVVDIEALSPEHKALWEAQEQDRFDLEAEYAAERRFGA